MPLRLFVKTITTCCFIIGTPLCTHAKAKNPYFTGEMCYSLRCSFLHDGNSDIKNWGDKEDADFHYSDTNLD